MIRRTARKRHVCEDSRWRVQHGQAPLCSGVIEPGTEYAEAVEWNQDPFHPPRYHLECFQRCQAELAERPTPQAGGSPGGPVRA